MLIQIFIVLFSIFAISRVSNKYFKKKEMSAWMFGAWTFLWVAILIVAIIPDFTSYIARFVGVGRGADLVTYISVIIIFYLIFRIYAKIYRIEKDITKIITHLAIDEYRDKKE